MGTSPVLGPGGTEMDESEETLAPMSDSQANGFYVEQPVPSLTSTGGRRAALEASLLGPLL